MERFSLLLAEGCDHIAALTPCKQKHPQNLSAITSFEGVLTREVILKLARAGFEKTLVCRPSYTQVQDCAANEEAVVVNLAVPYITDFVLVDNSRMNEIKSGNKCVVIVTPLIFLVLSVDLYLCLLRPPHVMFPMWDSYSPTKRYGRL